MLRRIFRTLTSHIQTWLASLYRQITEQVGLTANVHVRVYDTAALRDRHDDWDELAKPAKLQAVRDADPIAAEHTSNVTTVELHEGVTDILDPNQSTNFDVSHLAIGDDDSGASTGDTSLNNETNRFAITDSINNGATLRSSTFLDSSEANGVDIKEIGLVTASTGGKLLNHATLSTIAKDNTKTVTIDVDLTSQDA